MNNHSDQQTEKAHVTADTLGWHFSYCAFLYLAYTKILFKGSQFKASLKINLSILLWGWRNSAITSGTIMYADVIGWTFHLPPLVCQYMEKLLFEDIYAIQTLLFPNRLQMLQPTEILLFPACQKNLFNTLTMEQPTTYWWPLHSTQELCLFGGIIFTTRVHKPASLHLMPRLPSLLQ